MSHTPELGANCTSSCKTRDHRTWGECARAKSVATCGLESTGPGFSMKRQHNWNKELDAYQSAVRQGVQPEGTTMPKIEKAMRISEETGVAYRAETQ